MCEVDSIRRETCRNLHRWLRPYEESIVGLDDFQITGIPDKLSFTQQKNE